MARIPYPDIDKLSETKQALLRDPNLRVLNVSRMAMHAPDAQWAPQRALGQANLKSKTIDARLKEFVILRVGFMSNSAYEIYHHKPLGEKLGFTEAEFEALRTGDFSAFAPLEKAVCQFVTEVVRDVDPSDETLAAVRALVSDETLFEILFIVGGYMLTARVAAVSGADLDDETVRN